LIAPRCFAKYRALPLIAANNDDTHTGRADRLPTP
jgi:hypothetical protein